MDINAQRLEIAARNGATDLINSVETPDFADVLLKETGGLDVFIEASGNEHVINEGLRGLRKCAKMFMVGNPKDDIVIKNPMQRLTLSEVTLKGNWGRSMFWTWDKAEKFFDERKNRSA